MNMRWVQKKMREKTSMTYNDWEMRPGVFEPWLLPAQALSSKTVPQTQWDEDTPQFV